MGNYRGGKNKLGDDETPAEGEKVAYPCVPEILLRRPGRGPRGAGRRSGGRS